MDKIDIDFGVVIAQAKRLEELSKELENISNNSFEPTMQNIGTNWKGDNATLYLNKGNILNKNILTTSENLSDIAEKMAARARYIYAKEKAAIEIAKTRNY